MKVLHILKSSHLSGAENVVADICMMYEGEYEMMYCSPKGPIEQALVDRGVKYLSINKWNCKEVKHAIKTFNPDIIHAHDVFASVVTAMASVKIPVISSLHVNQNNMRKVNLKSVLYLIASKKIKKIIVVSESCLTDYIFRKQIEKKTIYLRNIIYAPRIENLIQKDLNNYNFDFVYIGRISFQKNPQKVAEVASAVLKNRPTAVFGVIGDGDLKNEMESIFKEQSVGERVVFTGRIPYPYKALKQAKCMLMCSRFEGTPIAALEAMALGVPIVSTPVDGMRSIVIDGKTGHLFSENEQLAQVIERLIEDKNWHDDMSMASIEQFNNLNNQKYYKDILRTLYTNTLIKL